MTTLEQAARQALDALENQFAIMPASDHHKALRAALAQQQAVLEKDWPQAKPVGWVGLTNKELYDCWPESNEPVAIARAIEAAFKEKNT